MSQKYHQGKYKVINKEKYKGDLDNIWGRSSWELRFMHWLDTTPEVLEWSSEENPIPYISPLDNKKHRYFIDFFATMRTSKGVQSFLIEIKPQNQTEPPIQPKRKTKQYFNKVMTYAINEAKFNAAKQYCNHMGWSFKILTEKQLFGNK